MTLNTARCLILACGNTLRSDDGVGPWLAEWAEKRFASESGVRVISRQQWTPELAEEIARAESVLFLDCAIDSAPGSIALNCAIDSAPGSVALNPVEPAAAKQGLATHHQGAPELLALARELYNSLPRKALLLTIGGGSTELGEEFSDAVTAALPRACRLIKETVLRLLAE